MNTWLRCQSTSEQIKYLHRHWSTLRIQDIQHELGVLTQLHPTNDGIGHLANLVAHAIENGLDNTVAELSASDTAQQLVRDWIATPTWTESQRFLESHPQLLTDDRHATILNNASGDSPRQHLGIVLLARQYPLSEVFDAVLDRGDARALLIKTISHGNMDLIRAIWFAAPALHPDDFARSLTAAVLAALDNDPNEALPNLAAAARAAASERDRTNTLRALRELNRGHNSAAVSKIVDAFSAPTGDGA